MVEKMKLVRVQGTMPQLNEFIGSCCMDGRFDLEPATRYMSESLGYGALNEENPHTAIRDQIETMARLEMIELAKAKQAEPTMNKTAIHQPSALGAHSTRRCAGGALRPPSVRGPSPLRLRRAV